jgi:hypothetical protein
MWTFNLTAGVNSIYLPADEDIHFEQGSMVVWINDNASNVQLQFLPSQAKPDFSWTNSSSIVALLASTGAQFCLSALAETFQKYITYSNNFNQYFPNPGTYPVNISVNGVLKNSFTVQVTMG